ncbi:3-hydroxyacyl-CoA dehydrogenase [Streptomyces sp. NPDC052042]|uniref:3-hydroxyacyl-CoA dehydrogenase n=1 Tax=Streptomyces sp. NPDC052042 TaxID=3365683 RepID=UPI0037D8C935
MNTARDRLVVDRLADGGLRIGELCGLRLVDLHLRENAACGECRAPHLHVCHRSGNPNRAETRTKHPWQVTRGTVTGGLIKRVSPAMVHSYFESITTEYQRGAGHGMLLVQLHGADPGAVQTITCAKTGSSPACPAVTSPSSAERDGLPPTPVVGHMTPFLGWVSPVAGTARKGVRMIVGIVGAGAMGRGIAQVTALAEHDVLVFDTDHDAVVSATTSIAESLDRAVDRGRTTREAADAASARIVGAKALDALAPCDLVIEAVVERADVKRAVFAQLEAIVGRDAVLASNTSSLSIASIAGALENRRRVVGLHFFNPVPAMRLVEIIGGPDTSDDVITLAREWVDSIGKVGVIVRDSPGFLVNLAGRAYATEALAILRDGVATIEQIDRIAKENLGFALGPFELMDLTGLDVNYTVTQNLFEHNFGDPQLRSTWYHRYLKDAGLLGRKTSRGFYDYRGSRTSEDPVSVNPAASTAAVTIATAGDRAEELAGLRDRAGLVAAQPDDADLILVAPLGTDASRTAEKLGLDPLRTVAIDRLVPEAPVQTLMVPPGVQASPVAALAARLRTLGDVEVIRDSPGFVAQRILAAIVNLAAQIAQRGISSPSDIDTAVKLGLRYPRGPLEWADHVGVTIIIEVLRGMYETDADQRYSPSPWLRRRAAAGLSALTPDFSS